MDDKYDESTQSELRVLLENQREQIHSLQMQIGSLENLVRIREEELRIIRSNKIFKILSATYHLPRKIYEKVMNAFCWGRQNENPLISIIIPVCCDNTEYLNKCLDSVLKQSYRNIEVILVNDCPSNGYVNQLLGMYKNDLRVRYLENEEELGKCRTINKALKVSTADWYTVVDSTDWLAPYAIESLMKLLVKKTGTVLGYTDSYRVNHRKRRVGFSDVPSMCYCDNYRAGEPVKNLLIIHRTVFARVGLFESKYEQTYILDFLLKVIFYMGEDVFTYLNKPVYYHKVDGIDPSHAYRNSVRKQTEKLLALSEKRYAIESGGYNKKLSFVILSLNKMEQTYECLQSIQATVKMQYEIVLLDNHSSEETVAFIKQNIEPMNHVKVIYATRNLGPAGGREAAVKHVDGDYLIFFDNDIVVNEKWLPELIIRLENYDRVGAVSCKVLFPDGLVQFNAMKSNIEEPFISFSLAGFRQANTNLETCDYEENDWVPGGATLYRTEVFKRLEGLTEYPNTYEDNEAGFQLKRLGYRILNAPSAIVIHNHYTYMEIKKGTEEYLAARYNDENLIKSSLTFYRRNGLIVKDEFILGKMGLNVNEAQKALEEFERRLQK